MIVSKISNCQRLVLKPKQQKSDRFEKVSFGNSSLVTAGAGVISTKSINQIKLPFDLNPDSDLYIYLGEGQLGFVTKNEVSNLYLAVIADDETCSGTNGYDKKHIIIFTREGKILAASNFCYDVNGSEVVRRRFGRTEEWDIDFGIHAAAMLYLDALLEFPKSRPVFSTALPGGKPADLLALPAGRSDNGLVPCQNALMQFTSIKEDDENSFPEDVGTFEKLPEKEALLIIEAFAKGLNPDSDSITTFPLKYEEEADDDY